MQQEKKMKPKPNVIENLVVEKTFQQSRWLHIFSLQLCMSCYETKYECGQLNSDFYYIWPKFSYLVQNREICIATLFFVCLFVLPPWQTSLFQRVQNVFQQFQIAIKINKSISHMQDREIFKKSVHLNFPYNI